MTFKNNYIRVILLKLKYNLNQLQHVPYFPPIAHYPVHPVNNEINEKNLPETPKIKIKN